MEVVSQKEFGFQQDYVPLFYNADVTALSSFCNDISTRNDQHEFFKKLFSNSD